MIKSVIFGFIPANGSDHAFFSWRANIDGTDYGQVYSLLPTDELSETQFRRWSEKALADIFKHERTLQHG